MQDCAVKHGSIQRNATAFGDLLSQFYQAHFLKDTTVLILEGDELSGFHCFSRNANKKKDLNVLQFQDRDENLGTPLQDSVT